MFGKTAKSVMKQSMVIWSGISVHFWKRHGEVCTAHLYLRVSKCVPCALIRRDAFSTFYSVPEGMNGKENYLTNLTVLAFPSLKRRTAPMLLITIMTLKGLQLFHAMLKLKQAWASQECQPMR